MRANRLPRSDLERFDDLEQDVIVQKVGTISEELRNNLRSSTATIACFRQPGAESVESTYSGQLGLYSCLALVERVLGWTRSLAYGFFADSPS